MITHLRKYITKFSAVGLTLILAFSSAVPSVFAASYGGYKVYDISIIDEKRQEIRGWGVTPSGYQNDAYEEPPVTTRNAARSAVFNDLGITMFRMDLIADCGYSDGSLNEAWMDKYKNYLKACVDQGITQYMVSTWNPPAGMWYVNEQGKRTLYEEYEDNFCKFVVNAFKDTIASGLPAPYAYSLQNEPQDGSKMVKYGDVQYIRVLKKMRKAFDENGLEDIMLLAGETAAHYQQKVIFGINFANLYNDPEFVNSIGAVITHSYVMTANSDDDDLYKFDMNLSTFPQLERWQTEFSGGPKATAMSNINNALFSTRVFIGDVCWGGMNRWFYWYGFFGTRQHVYADGRVRWMTTMDQTQALMYGDGYTEPKKTQLGVSLSTIWKNVPVGSYVYRCTTNDDDLVNKHALKADLIAFKNDKSTVLVSINNTGKEKHYNYNNLTGNSAKIYSITKDTVQEASYVKRNVINGSIKDFKCEPLSVNIIVTQNDDISEPEIKFDFDNSVVEKDGKYYTAGKDVKIKGTLDEKADLYVNGEKTELDENNGFEVVCDVEKKNPVVFECADGAGNKSKKISLEFVYQKDFINIRTDKTEDISTDNQYTVTGSANINTAVMCGDKEYPTDENGNFEISVSLNEGENEIKLTAHSGAKSAESTVNVFCDSVKPEITIENVPETTNDFEVIISGSVSEEVSSITVNGNIATQKDGNKFEIKQSLSEGDNEFTVTAVDTHGNVGEKTVNVKFERNGDTPHYVDNVAYVRHTTGGIKVDGILDEADWKMDLKMTKQVFGNLGATNISNFGLLWDDENLYIGAVVYDNDYKCEAKGPYSNDCVEFFVNPSNEKKGGYTKDDRQIFTGYINNDMTTYYKNKNVELDYAIKVYDDRYVVEIALPFSQINKTAEIGAKIGFDIVCNDNDTGASNRNAIVGWASEFNGNNNNTENFGTLVLSESDCDKYDDIEYLAAKAVKGTENDDTITKNGETLVLLDKICAAANADFYLNPNTGLINIFLADTSRVDLKENAYQIMKNGVPITFKCPVAVERNKFYTTEKERVYVEIVNGIPVNEKRRITGFKDNVYIDRTAAKAIFNLDWSIGENNELVFNSQTETEVK